MQHDLIGPIAFSNTVCPSGIRQLYSLMRQRQNLARIFVMDGRQ